MKQRTTPQSRLGFRAYTKESFYVHDDQGDPKGYRGALEIWLQPPATFLRQIQDHDLGLQAYRGEILPGTERGHHYHTHPRAYDFYYALAGGLLVALQDRQATIQELYYLDRPAVLIFPPFVAHMVRNLGRHPVDFLAFKTWNFAEDGSLTAPQQIALDPESVVAALACPLTFVEGRFGFAPAEWPTSQRPDGGCRQAPVAPGPFPRGELFPPV